MGSSVRKKFLQDEIGAGHGCARAAFKLTHHRKLGPWLGQIRPPALLASSGRPSKATMIRGEGSSSPSARLIIVRRRRQSQHEARRDTDGQQQREAKHHLEHEFPNLKNQPP